YPCCLPALGEFGEMVPHEGSARQPNRDPAPSRNRRQRKGGARAETAVTPAGFGATAGCRLFFWGCPRRMRVALQEDSPSGLWRTLGKRVGFTPSGVRIPHPPPDRRARTARCGPFVVHRSPAEQA